MGHQQSHVVADTHNLRWIGLQEPDADVPCVSECGPACACWHKSACQCSYLHRGVQFRLGLKHSIKVIHPCMAVCGRRIGGSFQQLNHPVAICHCHQQVCLPCVLKCQPSDNTWSTRSYNCRVGALLLPRTFREDP
jgi:hypothetical protein